ncbi:hypothetical protein [Sphingobacterium cavernae]|uniref:hypothetical protein n=1 Tax=Sphingobacterium cavernae TaxID=2592657 RepID=UPI00166A942A|nr:hypothetical protein [Sphingobacterium cavernae]
MALEMPEFVHGVDSIFRRDSERFEKLVIKREEEQRLIHSINNKRDEIKGLEE